MQAALKVSDTVWGETLNPFHHRLWDNVVQLFQRDFLCSLLRYARMDVHYLLHLAKLLMRDLASVGCIASANEMSQRMTLQLYAKPDSKTAVAAAAAIILKGETGKVWQAFPSQSQSLYFLVQHLHPHLFFYFSPSIQGSSGLRDRVHALCLWRDQQARASDDNPQLVLPDAMLLALARACPRSPREVKSFLKKHLEVAAGKDMAADAGSCRAAMRQVRCGKWIFL